MTSSSRFIWNANGVSSMTAGPAGQAANTSRWTRTIVGAVSPEPITTRRLMRPPPRPARRGRAGRRPSGRAAGRAGRGRRRRSSEVVESGSSEAARSGPDRSASSVADGGREQDRHRDLREQRAGVDLPQRVQDLLVVLAGEPRDGVPVGVLGGVGELRLDALRREAGEPLAEPVAELGQGQPARHLRRELGPALLEGRVALAEPDPAAVDQRDGGDPAVLGGQVSTTLPPQDWPATTGSRSPVSPSWSHSAARSAAHCPVV